MSSTFIISSVGFFTALILLFYFIAKYRAAEVVDTDEELAMPQDMTAQSVRAAHDAVRMFGKSAGPGAKELADLREKLKDLHYRLEEMKLLEEKRNTAAAAAIARVEQRVATFENEYVNKLQPTLYSLINELENIQNNKAK